MTRALKRPPRPAHHGPTRPTGEARILDLATRFDHFIDFVAAKFSRLEAQQERLRMALADMNATLAKIDRATDNIAADLKNLKTLIVPGMAQADVDAVQQRLDASAARLEGIAADTEDPVPAETPGSATP